MLSARSPKSTKEVAKKLENAQLGDEHVRKLCLAFDSTHIEHIFTCYRQHCAQRKPAGIKFTQRPILRFFAPQGRHVASIGVKFVPNFTPTGATTRV